MILYKIEWRPAKVNAKQKHLKLNRSQPTCILRRNVDFG